MADPRQKTKIDHVLTIKTGNLVVIFVSSKQNISKIQIWIRGIVKVEFRVKAVVVRFENYTFSECVKETC